MKIKPEDQEIIEKVSEYLLECIEEGHGSIGVTLIGNVAISANRSLEEWIILYTKNKDLYEFYPGSSLPKKVYDKQGLRGSAMINDIEPFYIPDSFKKLVNDFILIQEMK